MKRPPAQPGVEMREAEALHVPKIGFRVLGFRVIKGLYRDLAGDSGEEHGSYYLGFRAKP